VEKLKMGDGSVVEGDRFWDREEDLKLFIERIDRGANQLLVAQRRMGKTSLMAEVERQLRDCYICLFVDLQKAQNGADAMVELSLCIQPHKGLWERATGVFSNVLEKVTNIIETVQLGELGVTLRAGLTEGNWADKGDRLFEILAGSDKPVLLMLDEVPIMVNRMLKGDDYTITPERKRQTDKFMSWLRQNSIRHQGKVRIVISGSIGLEPILRQGGLSATINNFVPFELKPWDEECAKGCLDALANEYGVKFGEGVTDDMVSRLGCCIPHHVQMYFWHVYYHCRRRKDMACSVDDVEDVYNSDMLGVRGHAELTHYEERLERVLGKEQLPLALEMLTEAAVAGQLSKEAIKALQGKYEFEGVNAGEAQKEILWVLEHDGYLEGGRKGYVFVSKLVKDWWERRHGHFYTSILERGV